MDENRILDFQTRKQIYEFIFKYPGLHLRGLCRKLNFSISTLDYHLRSLEKQGLIEKRTNGGYCRYYIVNNVSKFDKKFLDVFRRKLPRDIILYVFSFPCVSLSQIAKFLNKNPRAIAFHMKKLIKLELIEEIPKGNQNQYIVDYAVVLGFLISYRQRLFDNRISHDLDWWDKHGFKPVDTSTLIDMDRMMEKIHEVFPHPYYC